MVRTKCGVSPTEGGRHIGPVPAQPSRACNRPFGAVPRGLTRALKSYRPCIYKYPVGVPAAWELIILTQAVSPGVIIHQKMTTFRQDSMSHQPQQHYQNIGHYINVICRSRRYSSRFFLLTCRRCLTRSRVQHIIFLGVSGGRLLFASWSSWCSSQHPRHLLLRDTSFYL
jgi:hypothetical protein